MNLSAHRRSRRGVLVAGLAIAAILFPVSALADDDDDLAQRIDPNQSQGSGPVVIDRGHVDFGPTLNTGEWRIQIHDDSATPSYWRHLDDVVMEVNDSSILEVPDSASYEFIGQPPGTQVWVVPQTQKTDVVWTGWNTQEPGVLESLNVGTTLSVLGVDGPGDVIAYLQSGNFGEPQPLWSTLDAFPQQTWIEVNTHTHANWVFTQPGIYLVSVRFDGELTTGETVSATDTLRFAVGDATDPLPAFDMVPADEGVASAAPAPSAPAVADEPADGTTNLDLLIVIVIASVAVVLIIAIVIAAAATRRTKARVLAARQNKEPAE